MSIEFRTRPDYNLGVLVHVGSTPDDEFLAFYKSFFESDAFDPSMNLLVDLREADSSTRSSEILQRFAEFVRMTLKDATTNTKVAVVAPRDLTFGLARMYEVFTDPVPWNFVVFRAMDAALAWLGLPEDVMNHRG